MFNGTKLTLNSDVDEDAMMFGGSLTYIIFKYIQLKILKRDQTNIRTQQYIHLNTGAKEFQQLNPGGPDQRHNFRPQPSIDKFYHV